MERMGTLKRGGNLLCSSIVHSGRKSASLCSEATYEQWLDISLSLVYLAFYKLIPPKYM
jgi:hypothetical protein